MFLWLKFLYDLHKRDLKIAAVPIKFRIQLKKVGESGEKSIKSSQLKKCKNIQKESRSLKQNFLVK